MDTPAVDRDLALSHAISALALLIEGEIDAARLHVLEAMRALGVTDAAGSPETGEKEKTDS